MERRRFIPIFVIVLSNFIGATIVIPVLPLFTQRYYHASPELVTLLYATFYIAQFFASPVMGRLSDRYGRLPVLFVSLFGTVVSFLIMGMADTLPVLFLARILDGITGGNVIVAQAYLADISAPKQRTRALGLVWAAFGTGLIFGPPLGGLLAQLGERAPFYGGAIISLLALLLAWFWLDESLTPEVRAKRLSQGSPRLSRNEVIHNTPLLLMLLIGFGGQFAMMLFQSTWSLYAGDVLFQDMSAADVTLRAGLLFAVHGVGQLLTQLLLIEPLAARFGEHRLVILGAILRALSLWSLVLLPFPLSVATIGMLGFAVGSGTMMPSLQSLVTTSVREEVSGAVLGVYQSAVSLGIISGAILSGFLFERSPLLPYAVAGVIFMLTLMPASILSRFDVRTAALA